MDAGGQAQQTVGTVDAFITRRWGWSTDSFWRLRMPSFPEGADLLMSHLAGENLRKCIFAWEDFLWQRELPVHQLPLFIVQGPLAIWTTQSQCFPKEGRMEERGLTPRPPGNHQMARCLFSLDDSEQPSHPRKANLILPSASSFLPLQDVSSFPSTGSSKDCL